MAKNKSLHAAKRKKNDEFYTMYKDIEQELQHYHKELKDKDLTILCNCDDPFESNFFKYFTQHFHYLGLKRLIGISYKGSPIAGQTMKDIYGDDFNIDTVNHGYVVDVNKYVYDEKLGFNWNIALQQIQDFPENKIIELKEDGSFQSDESIEYLKQADVIVTNPPFSEFREFMDILVKYNKRFIVLGSLNAISYKEIFPLIKGNKLWLGVSSPKEFILPYKTDKKNIYQNDKGQWIAKMGNILWYTNIDHYKRHEKLPLCKSYKGNEENYPKYDNYDAIEVSKVRDIPYDYEGIMGVPITFLDKWNPEQFKIIGITNHGDMAGIPFINNCFAEVKGKRKYVRIFIKNLNPVDSAWDLV